MTVVTHVPGADGEPVAVVSGQTLPQKFATTLTDLHAAFQQHAKEDGYRGLGKIKFRERLTRQNGVRDIRIGGGKNKQRGYNVIFKTDEDIFLSGTSGTVQHTTGIGMTEEKGANRTGEESNGYGDSASNFATPAPVATGKPDEDNYAESSEPGARTVTADVDDLTVWVYDVIAADPAKATEGKVREALRISSTEYHAARDWLIANGVVAKRSGRGFDLLARLVQTPAPYIPLSDAHFVNRPDEPVASRALLTVDPRPCPECGEPEDGESAYFPFCSTHRREIA